MSQTARRRLIALGLGVVAFAAVLRAQSDLGVVRDEVVYMDSGSKYARWWLGGGSGRGLTLEQNITAHFGGPGATDNNREHPPLMKTLFGFSERLFHQKLGWTGQVTAYRVPNAAMFALWVILVVLFSARVWGNAVGLAAGLFALLLPRMFFHAGLATFDAPMATLWLATIYAYYRTLSTRYAGLVVGVVLGLALATKHNAIMLPAVIIPHYLWVCYRAGRAKGAAGIGAALRDTQPLLLVSLFAVSQIVLIALWPWLWFDTFEHIEQWLEFHLSHVHYNFEYLGDNWNSPPFPWHVPIVTTLFVVPVVTLLAGAIGAASLAVRAAKGRAEQPERSPALLLFLSAGVSMGPFLLRTTPIFGAEKHWTPAFATICIFAGIGIAVAARLLVAQLARHAQLGERARNTAHAIATGVLIAVCATAALAETVSAQPYALSHYNALAGGAPGGADRGMNRQFWGYSARGALPYINQFAPAKGQPAVRVYTHDADKSWRVYAREGLLEPGLPHAGQESHGINNSKIAIVIHELHFSRHDYLIWKAYGTVRPSFVLTSDGVPIVSVYVRP